MVFIMGVFSKRATGKADFWGLIISFVLGMFRLAVKVIYYNFVDTGGTPVLEEYIANKTIPANWSGLSVLAMKFLAINWRHYCIFLFFLTLVVIWVISLFTKKPSAEQIQGLTYGSATLEQIEETRRS